MRNFRYMALLVSFLAVGFTGQAQTKQDRKERKKIAAAELRQLMHDRTFTFVAEFANPQHGGHRYLTSDYDVKVTPDSVISYLPYFGEGYFDPPYRPEDAGIKFTSTKFDLKAKEKTKGGWQIIISPKDAKYIQHLIFDISTDGSASVSFSITNRSGISFDGYIKEKTDIH